MEEGSSNFHSFIKQNIGNSSLPHFLLVYPPYDTTFGIVTNYIKMILEDVYQDKIDTTHTFWTDNIIYYDSSEKKLTKANVDEIFGFCTHPSKHTVSSKVIILDHFENIDELILNKLLKLIEEPPIKLIIIGINTTQTELLSTIESRSFKYRITKIELEKAGFSSEAKVTPILEKFKEYDALKKNITLKDLNTAKVILNEFTKNKMNQNFIEYEKFINFLKNYQMEREYNSPGHSLSTYMHQILDK